MRKLIQGLTSGESLTPEGSLSVRQQAAAGFSYTPANSNEAAAVQNLLDTLPDCLYTEIETIHGNTVTLNYTYYPNVSLLGDGVATGYKSFVVPYPKPLIKNHDTFEEPLGRAVRSAYKEEDGIGIPVVLYAITEKEAIRKVLDGSYLTTSIGARTDAFVCSICGCDWMDDEQFEQCYIENGHRRGQMYDGKLMYLKTGTFIDHENSFVNVPADVRARVVRPSVQVGLGNEMFNIFDPSLVRRLTTSIHPVNGLKESVQMKPTLGELFGIPTEHERFAEEGPWTEEELAAMPEDLFALEGKRFPLADAQLATEMSTLSQWVVDSSDEQAEEEVSNESVEESEATEDTETEEVEESIEEPSALEVENSELKQRIAELEEKLVAKEAEVEESKKALEDSRHEMLLDTVSGLKVLLGDSDSVESIREKLANRSSDSLRDTYDDLIERATTTKPTTADGQVRPTPSIDQESLLKLIQNHTGLANLPIVGEDLLDKATQEAMDLVEFEDDEETVTFATDPQTGKTLLCMGLPSNAMESLVN